MKITYRKTIYDKIVEAKQAAHREGKEIESIELTQDEMTELKKVMKSTAVFAGYRDVARRRDEIAVTVMGIKVFTPLPHYSLAGWGTEF